MVLVPPVAPLVSSLEPAVPMLALSQISGEGLLRQESAGGGVLTLQVPQVMMSARTGVWGCLYLISQSSSLIGIHYGVSNACIVPLPLQSLEFA